MAPRGDVPALSYPARELTDGVVTLRPFAVADAAWVAEVSRDTDIQRWSIFPSRWPEAEVRGWIGGMPGALGRGELNLAVTDARDGALLGQVGLSLHSDRAEVFYWLGRSARGRGVATRAVRLLAEWAENTLDTNRLEIETHVDNVASQAVAERAGFVRKGLRKDKRLIGGQWVDMVVFVRQGKPPPG